MTIGVKAAEKIRDFMAKEGDTNLFVRVALVQTHCMGGAGYTYQLGFEKRIRDSEECFESDGIRLAVEKSSASRLSGTSIDYVETLERQGFVIKNPNAIAKCPCGHHDIFSTAAMATS